MNAKAKSFLASHKQQLESEAKRRKQAHDDAIKIEQEYTIPWKESWDNLDTVFRRWFRNREQEEANLAAAIVRVASEAKRSLRVDDIKNEAQSFRRKYEIDPTGDMFNDCFIGDRTAILCLLEAAIDDESSVPELVEELKARSDDAIKWTLHRIQNAGCFGTHWICKPASEVDDNVPNKWLREVVRLAIIQRNSLQKALQQDKANHELQAKIADFRTGGGDASDDNEGAIFPAGATMLVLAEQTPRKGFGAFQTAYKNAIQEVNRVGIGSHVLPKLEAVRDAHKALQAEAQKACEASRLGLSSLEQHNRAVSELMNFAAKAEAVIDKNEPTEAASNKPLTGKQILILQKMLHLEAIDSDNRTTSNSIARAIDGPNASDEDCRRAMKGLREAGFCEAKKGRGGGVWLTAKGLERANKIDEE